MVDEPYRCPEGEIVEARLAWLAHQGPERIHLDAGRDTRIEIRVLNQAPA